LLLVKKQQRERKELASTWRLLERWAGEERE
jgi:hypothetical protein